MSRPCHVILADDDELLRAFMQRVVARLQPSATVTVVDNGHAALHAYAHSGADLLITDCDMPRMDGITLISILRLRHSAVPIIARSGYPDRERAAIEAGATRFLEKPFTIQQLAQVLTDVLAS